MPPIPPSEPDLSHTVLGHYRLLRRLGAGGMGSVYLAQHELIDRQVALKVLHPSLAARPLAQKRFLREARAASKVKHPGVVEIHDVAFFGEHVYFVMELLPGRDLAARLAAEGRLSWPQAFPIVLQVADALAAAHAVGVVHRDVKPSNCFLVAEPGGGERVKVVDFGIAKVTADERSPADVLTATGEVFGTLGYMAPEMAQGPGDDPRSDIYALGVMMFELLTGRLPFLGTSLQMVSQHLTMPPVPPRSLEPSIPPAVERVVLRALEKHPDDRFPSMRHLVAALQAVAPGAVPPPRERSPRVPPGSHPPPVLPPITTADVVDLDQRADAPRGSSSAGDPWRSPKPTTAYGEEPPPPPAEPELSPALFRAPAEPPVALELDPPPPPPVEPARPRARWRRQLPVVLLAATLVTVAAALWLSREPPVAADRQAAPAPLAPAPEPVLLHIDTVPRDARIYIDDALARERPVAVPRSERYLRVRVEADGHDPRTIQVQPLATRRLQVKLERTKPGKR
jgi:eukaryotic-like serine/threonine-protein kinase